MVPVRDATTVAPLDHGTTQAASTCIDLLRQQVDMALCHVKQQCTVNDKFEHALLDNYQRVCYELAFCVAELKAAAVLIDYADNVQGGWVLNGAKMWCTFAARANVLLTLARSNPDPQLGHKGLSLFLVEKPAFAGHQFDCEQAGGGTLTGKAISTIGYRGMHSFELFFDNYFVPEEGLLGGEKGEGRGFYNAMAGFAGGRIQTAARATGVMQAALDKAIVYAQDRKVFAAPVGDFQLTQVKLARMLGALTAARQFSYAVADMMDSGTGQMEASLVKLFACRAAEWVTREAM